MWATIIIPFVSTARVTLNVDCDVTLLNPLLKIITNKIASFFISRNVVKGSTFDEQQKTGWKFLSFSNPKPFSKKKEANEFKKKGFKIFSFRNLSEKFVEQLKFVNIFWKTLWCSIIIIIIIIISSSQMTNKRLIPKIKLFIFYATQCGRWKSETRDMRWKLMVSSEVKRNCDNGSS